jgi:dynein heavy chain, axonemal
MINNMMIENATTYLESEALFQGEPDESLVILCKVLTVLETHKTCFKEYREKLSSYVLPDTNPVMWTFLPKDIFERFDLFLKRLYTVRDIFDTANEFYKVEKIELGGVKGRNHSRCLQEIFNDFKNIYVKWSQIQFDVLDPSPTLKHFDKEWKIFREKAEVLERKLAAVLVQAFDECYTIESLIKLIVVCGSILQRPIIFKEIEEQLEKVVKFYGKELTMVKVVFDKGFEDIQKGGIDSLEVDRGFPPVAGALTWIKKIKTRISKPIEDLPSIEFKDVFESQDGKYYKDQFKEMCNLLTALETEIFLQWKEKAPDEINSSMKKCILKSIENGQIDINFDAALDAALKEVKLLKAMNQAGIPDVALELFEISKELWVCQYGN